MKQGLKIIIAQCNFRLGQIATNITKILKLATQAYQDHQADLIAFPELTLTGYPPEDLLFRLNLYDEITAALLQIRQQAPNITLVIGHPYRIGGRCFNAASVIQAGKIQLCYFKQHLPNYSVFDEKRYFYAGTQAGVFELKGWRIALSICEDLWQDGPMQQAHQAGAELMLCLNASPYDHLKQQQRYQILQQNAQLGHMPIVYVQCVGGQDELVFDGGSMILNEQGQIVTQADYFQEGLYPVEFPLAKSTPPIFPPIESPKIDLAHIYQALCLGVKDYVKKNNFKSVLLGLSGGIDSALSLAIAVDALGPNQVHAVMLPSPYTSKLSLDSASEMAQTLKIHYQTIPINHCFDSMQQSFNEVHIPQLNSISLQNMQARIRAVILMTLSNQFGHLLLSTSNKSETAVGYTTLYGDMAGGFCVLKDVFKTIVYQLANYRNQQSAVIPQAIIDRPPTAELAHQQTDQDTLPAYDELDAILMRYIEQDESIDTIVTAGFSPEVVQQVVQAVDRAEYKRRQAPPGVKITTRAFGRDRRYPISR